MGVLRYFPSPPINGFSLGPLNIRFYGLMIGLGVVVAIWLIGKRFVSKGVGTVDNAQSITMWGVIAGLVGARLYHVVTDWQLFVDDLVRIPKIWTGGLGIPGGLLFGVLGAMFRAKQLGIAPLQALSCAAPAIPLAQAIGRWGNWFNQELYGRPTTLPWGLKLDDTHFPAGFEAGTLFHPTFLYESLWNLSLCGLLLWLDRRFRFGSGRLFALYIVGYGIGRFWVEGLRIDTAKNFGGLRLNQWVALVAIVAGATWFWSLRHKVWPQPEAAGDDAVTGSGTAAAEQA